jgi:hypothetical protein
MITVKTASIRATEELERVGLQTHDITGGFYITGKRLAPGKMTFTHKGVNFCLDNTYHLTVEGETAETRRADLLYHLNVVKHILLEMEQNRETTSHYRQVAYITLDQILEHFGDR